MTKDQAAKVAAADYAFGIKRDRERFYADPMTGTLHADPYCSARRFTNVAIDRAHAVLATKACRKCGAVIPS